MTSEGAGGAFLHYSKNARLIYAGHNYLLGIPLL